jgi:hypothetical protein
VKRIASILLFCCFALLRGNLAIAQSAGEVDMNQFVDEARTVLTEVQTQLAAQNLPALMQVRLELQAERGPSGVRVLQASDAVQPGITSQAGLLLVVPNSGNPAGAATNPLMQSLENLLVAQAAALPLTKGKGSGTWLAHDITINFTVTASGPQQIAFNPVLAPTKLAAGTPVHQIILTFALPQ